MAATRLWEAMQDVCCTTTPSCQRGAQTPPPVGYPRCVALPGIEPECAPCNVRPLHRQSGPSCPDTLTNLPQVGCAPASSRLDCDPPSPKASAGMPGSLRCSPVPIEQGGDFALPLHPHRPTLRGLDGANVSAVGSRPAFAEASAGMPGRFPLAPEPHRTKSAALGDPAFPEA